jgi:cytochrome c553
VPPAGAEPPAGGPALEALLAGCGQCHGADGNADMPGVPSLAGQPATFLETQLILFRERLRRSAAMAPQVQGLDDPTVIALAAHYAGLAARAAPEAGDPAQLAKGRELAKAGRCGSCHLPDFTGRQQIPRLAGQREDYLAAALAAYRDETRGGADTTMINVMRGATDAEIEALAHFLAQQGAAARN